MMFNFRSCLILLGLLFFNIPSGTPLAVDVVHDPVTGVEPSSPAFPGTDETASTARSIDAAPDLAPAVISPRYDEIVFYVTPGQQFSFWIVSFLVFNINDAKIAPNPASSWVTLDPTKRAITGQVPLDCPASRIEVNLTVWYNIGWRVIGMRVCVILEVQRSASSSTSWPASSSTSRSTGLGTSLSGSKTATTTTSLPTSGSTSRSTSSFTLRPTWTAFLNVSIPSF